MIKVKWRKDQRSEFEFYSEIPEDYIKMTTGLIKPNRYALNTVSFRFLPEGVNQEEIINENEYTIYNIEENYNFYIQGGLLMTYHQIHPVSRLVKKNFTHFKIDDNPWVDIQEISYGFNNKCIASLEEKIFAVLGELYSYVNETNDAEINDFNLKHKDPNDLYNLIKAREVISW